jgi:HAMP domain-containing protein
LLVARDNRWPAVAYLTVAGALLAFVVWVWLSRHLG